MKTRSKLLALAAAGGVAAVAGWRALLSRHPVGNRHVPEPARPVDLKLYAGRWFEIARYEQPFEKGCEGVTAEYSLGPNGMIIVVNRCRMVGRTREARGRARIVDHETAAKLKVSFFGPFYGDYWVLDHADDYGWSIVGEPSGRYLWILARSAIPPATIVDAVVDRAAAMGYDTSMLVRTVQP